MEYHTCETATERGVLDEKLKSIEGWREYHYQLLGTLNQVVLGYWERTTPIISLLAYRSVFGWISTTAIMHKLAIDTFNGTI